MINDKNFGSYGLQPEPTLFKGKVNSAWSQGAGFLSIVTYQSPKIEEVSGNYVYLLRQKLKLFLFYVH